MVRSGGVRRMFMIALVVLAPAYGAVTFAQARAGRAAAAPPQQPRVYASMLQVMRGVLYPASNVIFTAQFDDPASFKRAEHESTSSDPFTSSYGGWEAVENSGMALAESANLLIIPRACGNGKPAPVGNPDWQMWVQELREAGLAVYKTGQAKNADGVLEAADVLATACLHCHVKYRNVPGGISARC